MIPFGKVLFVAVSIAYPVLVFVGLTVFRASPRFLSLCLVAVAISNFLAYTQKRSASPADRIRVLVVSAVVVALIAAIAATNSPVLLKAYPVAVSLLLLSSFGYTLIRPPTMIFRFASLQDRSVLDSPDRPSIEAYCRTVTVVWCCFFAFNASIALSTTLFASDLVWSLYNGLVSYVLIGLLLVGELVVRRIRIRR